ncbi:MAG: FIG00454323: hypothetical protein [uncultured Caballeronia sp.]|nr:MAG: FIG00454323: hypothetical protein [uncultured Caballeronia sp.]
MSRTSKSVVIALLVVIVVAVLGWIYASPYIAFDWLKRAANARDAQTVNQYVDFPLLRESLKDQVRQLLTRKIDIQKSGNPLAMIGTMIGAALIGPLVDSYATPDGVAAILNGIPPRGNQGEKPPVPSEASGAVAAAPGAVAPQPQPAAPAQPAPTVASPPAPKPPPQTTAGYRSFDTFAVNYQHGAGNARYSAIFRRYGLFLWKLVAVELNGS